MTSRLGQESRPSKRVLRRSVGIRTPFAGGPIRLSPPAGLSDSHISEKRSWAGSGLAGRALEARQAFSPLAGESWSLAGESWRGGSGADRTERAPALSRRRRPPSLPSPARGEGRKRPIARGVNAAGLREGRAPLPETPPHPRYASLRSFGRRPNPLPASGESRRARADRNHACASAVSMSARWMTASPVSWRSATMPVSRWRVGWTRLVRSDQARPRSKSSHRPGAGEAGMADRRVRTGGAAGPARVLRLEADRPRRRLPRPDRGEAGGREAACRRAGRGRSRAPRRSCRRGRHGPMRRRARRRSRRAPRRASRARARRSVRSRRRARRVRPEGEARRQRLLGERAAGQALDRDAEQDEVDVGIDRRPGRPVALQHEGAQRRADPGRRCRAARPPGRCVGARGTGGRSGAARRAAGRIGADRGSRR